ncbi:MAG: DUF11 domain-containing protein [Caldilineaceae bacterium]|nr:DUF11 domain-containing protein [Caldilineaceae bacterium]
MRVKRIQLQPWLTLVVLTSIGILGFMTSQLVWSKPQAAAITQWQTTATLPEGIASRNAVTHGNFVYVVGGKIANENPTATIYGAPLTTAGGLGGWAVMGQLPTPLYLHAAVVAGDALFIVGGWDGRGTRSEVWRAPFLADGRIGAWAAMPAYPIALDLHDAAFLNGRIYVVGGWDGVRAQQAIYAATVESNGLGAWQKVGDLPQPLYRLAIAAHGQQLYVTGGYQANEVTSGAVYIASLNSSGAITNWQTTPLPVALYYHKAVIYAGQLVVLGGRDNTQVFNQVYAAALNGDGSIGTWQAAPPLPVAIYRMAAVTVNRYSGQYIFVLGGARSETDYQSAAYHSDAPTPPTPTPTPTITPTPTPTPGVVVALASEPPHWIAPGEVITYLITYHNQGPVPVSAVTIDNRIPDTVELVPNSIRTTQGSSTTTGTQPGAQITWQLGNVNSGATGQVSYQARRSVSPTPAVPPALTIEGAAPATAEAGEEITYAFTLANHAPTALSNLVVTNVLPPGVRYVSGGDGAPINGVVRWSLPTLAADSSTTVTVVVVIQESAANSDYRVATQEGTTARGRTILITKVDGRTPTYGDGVTITNAGARITWSNQGETTSATSQAVSNPAFVLYLPLIRQ